MFQNRKFLIGVTIVSVLLFVIMATVMVTYFIIQGDTKQASNVQQVSVGNESQEAIQGNAPVEQTVVAQEQSTSTTDQQSEEAKTEKRKKDEKLLAEMKAKNQSLFTKMTNKMEENQTGPIDDPFAALDRGVLNVGGFWTNVLYFFQNLPVTFIVCMVIFGFIMSWIYKDSPPKRKAWLLFAIGSVLLYLFSIYGTALFSSMQG